MKLEELISRGGGYTLEVLRIDELLQMTSQLLRMNC